MSQKFIQIHDRTAVKKPIYVTESAKKFQRKRVVRSSHSNQSKQSNQSRITQQHYIKPKLLRSNNCKMEQNFFQKVAKSMVIQVQESTKYETCRNITERKKYDNKDNYIIKLQTIEAELDLRNHEFALINNQYERAVEQTAEERDKRKKVEREKKALIQQINELNRQLRQVDLEKNKVVKEKEYLQKQIQFLERINYDDKVRTIQSYREIYMVEQLDKLKTELRERSNHREKELEMDLDSIRDKYHSLSSEFNSIKTANQCLLRSISAMQQKSKECITQSEEYVTLREKYKQFLNEYRRLRNQYWEFKNHVQSNQDEVNSLTLSVCSDHESN